MPTIRKTTIYVATKEWTEVFASPKEIPGSLRREIVRSTRGMNSATILIADRGGREEIRKVLAGEPSALAGRLRGKYFRRAQKGVAAASAGATPPSRVRETAIWKRWIGQSSRANWRWISDLLLPGAVGLGLWLLFTFR
jgi:hypothetical protein